MSKRTTYVPKHRHVPDPIPRTSSLRAPRKVLRTTVLLSSVAVVTTGIAVSGGVLGAGSSVSTAAADLGATLDSSPVAQSADQAAAELVKDRESTTSRSADRRKTADPQKAAALSVSDDGPAVTRSVELSDSDPRDIALALLPEFGFSSDQFGCLDSLWTRESGWNPSAANPTSSAYGIPQALPGSKMSSAGADWATNPATQISWGLGYIQDRYGSPCGAWGHSQSSGWY